MKKYQFPFSNKNVPLDTLKFIFGQAEKFLISTVETGSTLNTRALNLLQILIPLLAGLLGYIATLINKKPYPITFEISLFFSVVLFISIGLAGLMYWLRSEYDAGSEPSKLSNKELLNYDIEIEKTFIINEIENYQNRINFNLAQNKKRVIWFMMAISNLILGLLIVMAYLIYAFNA